MAWTGGFYALFTVKESCVFARSSGSVTPVIPRHYMEAIG